MPRQLARRRVPVTNYDDEPDEATSPDTGRRSRRARDDDEDARERHPARGRRSNGNGDDPPPRRGRHRDDDDEDEGSRHRSSRTVTSTPRAKVKAKARGGWDTVQQNRQAKYANPGRLQVKDKEVLVKFLEPEPFATYGQHWVGQRSYTCGLNADYGKCPLCDIGNPVRYLALFNVADMASAENRYWEVGPEATKTLLEYADEDERTSPLDRDGQYFTAKRFKKDNGFYGFKISAVKERDLDEEFDTEPLEEGELDAALENLFDDAVVPLNTLAELRGAAKEEDDE